MFTTGEKLIRTFDASDIKIKYKYMIHYKGLVMESPEAVSSNADCKVCKL